MTRKQAWAAATAPHALFSSLFTLLTLCEELFQFLFVYLQSVNKIALLIWNKLQD